MLLRTIAVLFILLFFSIISIANIGSGFSYHILAIIHGIPMGDKVLHFLLVGLFTLAMNLFLRQRTVAIWQQKHLLGSFLVVIFITIEECSQSMIPHRHFELLDMLCNYAGILAADYLLKQQYLTILINKRSFKKLFQL